MNCRACDEWPLAEGDRFCPQCGAFVLEVSLAAGPAAPGAPARPVLRLDRPPPAEWEDLELAFATARADDETLIDDPSMDLPLLAFEDGLSLPVVDIAPPAGVSAAVTVGVATRIDGRRRLVRPRLAALQFLPPASTAGPASTVLQADAILPAAEGGGAWARVRLVNTGPATTLTRARLAIAGAPWDAAAPAAGPPTLLLPGESVVMRAWISPAGWRAVREAAAPPRATLTLWDGQDREIAPAWRLDIVRDDSLTVALGARERLAALAGRPMRLPLRLANAGGQAARVVGATLTVGDAAPLSITPDGGWGEPLRPGAVQDVEVRAPTPPATRPRSEPARVELTLAGDDGSRLLVSRAFDLDIRPAGHGFVGRLCVDFGTTESAVAAVAGGQVRRGQDEPPPAPFMVDLGRVSIDGPGEGERFLPSAAARLRDGAIVFGRAAMAADPRDTVERAIDFKWDLRDETAFGAAVGYLRALRDLVESHPDIAGEIGAQTTLFATCPTRFAPGLRSRLCAALRAAGFPDPRTDVFDPGEARAGTLIAESWSPLPYAVVRDSALFAALGGAEGAARPLLALSPGEAGHVVVFDVGGGSADLSVLRVERRPDGALAVRETWRRTDRAFTGRRFSAVMEASLAAYTRRAGGGRHDRDALIRTFQFAESDSGDGVQARGVFAEDALRDPLRRHFARRLAGETSDMDETVLRAAMAARRPASETGPDARSTEESRRAEAVRGVFEARAPLALGPPGQPGGLILSTEPMIDLASLILADFTRVFTPILSTLMDAAVSIPLAEGGPMILIPSGRGAAFPLARELIVQAWRRTPAGAQPVSELKPREAKSITAWGGLMLADLARAGHGYVIDLEEDQRVLAFVHRDPIDGEARHAPLPWAAAPGHDGGVAAVRLSDLPNGAIFQQRVVLKFGDPDGADADWIGEISLGPGVREPAAHWLIVEVDTREGLTFRCRVAAGASREAALAAATAEATPP